MRWRERWRGENGGMEGKGWRVQRGGGGGTTRGDFNEGERSDHSGSEWLTDDVTLPWE